MFFLEYFSQHPDRLRRLDNSEGFFATCGSDPIYIDPKRGLVDIMTLASYITLHGGAKLGNVFSAMESYLAGDGLRHSKDTVEAFVSASEEIKEMHKKDKHKAGKRKSPKNPLPFFIHPETAFGFMRLHMRSSAELYGQPLSYNSELINPHVRNMIVAALEKIKEKNYIAWYLAAHWVDLKLQAKELIRRGVESEFQLDVFVRIAGGPPEHARVELVVKDGEVMIPELKTIMAHPEVLKYLPNFTV